MRKLEKSENHRVQSLAELSEFTVQINNELGQRGILLLSGDVGSGKTKLVESLLRKISNVATSSPTFALHQRYATQLFFVDHFDFYRIENISEIESTGLWDLFSQENGWIIIEWPKFLKVADLPAQWPIVAITLTVEGTDRIVELKKWV